MLHIFVWMLENFSCGMTVREREKNEENFLNPHLLWLKFYLKNLTKSQFEGELAATNYNFVAFITRWKLIHWRVPWRDHFSVPQCCCKSDVPSLHNVEFYQHEQIQGNHMQNCHKKSAQESSWFICSHNVASNFDFYCFPATWLRCHIAPHSLKHSLFLVLFVTMCVRFVMTAWWDKINLIKYAAFYVGLYFAF